MDIDHRTKPEETLTDDNLSMPARVIYAWMHARPAEAVTIQGLAEIMKLHRVSASVHLNALERAGHLVRFLPNGGNAEHHWRLTV